MKTSQRIRKNGSAASSPRQVKTPAKKVAQENVTIVITDDAMNEQAEFEIPRCLYDAMVHSAITKGMSLAKWFEDAVRASLEKHKQAEPVSVPGDADAPQTAALIIPSHVVIECKDALSRLEGVGHAAGALVMMNAEIIADASRVNDGWQSLGTPRFTEGSQELARMTVGDFHDVVAKLSIYLHKMMAQIDDCNEPLKAVSRAEYAGFLMEREGADASLQLEDVVGSFRHCIKLQSSVLSGRNNAGAYDMGMQMNARLDNVFETVWAATNNLEGAFLAATIAHDQSVRKEAA